MKKMLAIAIAVVILAAPSLAQAQGGALDLSFGHNGKSIKSVSLYRGEAKPLSSPALARLHGGGTVVLVGKTLFALRPHGDLDRHFGGGRVQIAAPLGASFHPADVAVDTHGRILAAGTLDQDAFVARYSQDGTLDPSFAEGGVLRSDFGMEPPSIERPPNQPQTSPPLTQVSGMVLEPDGHILLSGVHVGAISTCRGAVEYPYKEAFVSRLSQNGDLDNGFGQAGVSFIPDSAGLAPPVLVPGSAEGVYLMDRPIWGECDVRLQRRIIRLGSGGTLEASFHVADLQWGALNNTAAMTLDLRGRILTVEPGGQEALVRRFAHGVLDPSFGKNGVARIEPARRRNFVPSAIQVDQAGKIVVAGTLGAPGREEARETLVARLTTRGAVDRRFGRGGRVFTRFGRHAEVGSPDLLIAKRGTLLLGTEVSRPSLPDGEGLALASYLNR